MCRNFIFDLSFLKRKKKGGNRDEQKKLRIGYLNFLLTVTECNKMNNTYLYILLLTRVRFKYMIFNKFKFFIRTSI